MYLSENGRIYEGEFKSDKPTGEFPKFNNECPFIFNINDLISPSENTSEILKQVYHVFQCHIVNLKAVYKFYCKRRQLLHTPSLLLKSSPGVISRLEIWHFLKHCMKPSKNFVSRIEFDRLYAKKYKDSKIMNHIYMNPHSYNETFIFHDFLDFLLRVSASSGETLINGLSNLLKNDINFSIITKSTLNSNLDSGNTGNIEIDALEDSFYRQIHIEFSDRVYKMYHYLASNRKNSLNQGDKTLCLRDVLYMVHELGMLDSVLTISKVVEFFSYGANGFKNRLSDGTFIWLEFELVPLSFFEALMFFAKVKAKVEFDRVKRIFGGQVDKAEKSLEKVVEKEDKIVPVEKIEKVEVKEAVKEYVKEATKEVKDKSKKTEFKDKKEPEKSKSVSIENKKIDNIEKKEEVIEKEEVHEQVEKPLSQEDAIELCREKMRSFFLQILGNFGTRSISR